jgi:hypothetical protein
MLKLSAPFAVMFPEKLSGIEMKDRTKQHCSFVAFAALLFLIILAPLQANHVNAQINPSFSIVQITDTQYLSSSYPSSGQQLTNWIVANNASYNFKMVIHTGDIVDVGSTCLNGKTQTRT